ncbi:hypothetical protein CANARDRAFT_174393 [[Candida] arabinofermentans NRRL YB-2248]|uniref:PH domain-containing protein n=1 Tax=[Candida] arabinofermentans NRRL YB-2248 TaxID=983967 RepID=A0A1E4T6D5_9ASCO|nr:hypothetical protein CANARDRAFT_174393 [[Candida] arabinofermentans NRRL YB-2248]
MGTQLSINSTQTSSLDSFVTANEILQEDEPDFKILEYSTNPQLNSNDIQFDQSSKVNKREIPLERTVAFSNVDSGIHDKPSKIMKRPGKSRFTLEMVEPAAETSNFEDTSEINSPNSQIKNIYSRVNDEVVRAYEKIHIKSIGSRHLISTRYSKYEQKQKLKKLFEEFSAGKIIKLEKMLVLVMLSNQKRKYDTTRSARVIEKWKEYIVVARSTGNHEYPVVLQFFKNRTIAEYDEQIDKGINLKTDLENDDSDTDSSETSGSYRFKMNGKQSKSVDHKNCEFEVPLSPKNTVVGFHNLLDKSISIQRPSSKHKRTQYIILPQTPSSAVRWLSFLTDVLKADTTKHHKTILVRIPDLDLSLTLKNIHRLSTINDFHFDDESVLIKYTKQGYELPRLQLFSKLIKLISSEINSIGAKVLPTTPKAIEFLRLLGDDHSMLAFAAKKFDRLEWILGENEKLLQSTWLLLNDTHDIQLRELRHETFTLEDGSLTEPSPIEGFLSKLSNRRGNLKSKFGRNYYKLNYIATVDNLIFFQNFYSGVPLFEESMVGVLSPVGDILDHKILDQRIASRKSIFKYTPYPLNDSDKNHIKWLVPGISMDQFQEHDDAALFEIERRSCIIVNSHGIIDMCNVADVRTVPFSEIPVLIKMAASVSWGLSTDQLDNQEYTDACFEIVLKNGTITRFQACSRFIRDEWVGRLQLLVEYWKMKKREEMLRLLDLRDTNMNVTTVSDDFFESGMVTDDYANKWETSQAQSDPQVYNISSWTIDKAVIMSGLMYQKRKKHKSFVKFFVVLCPGFLILYELCERKKSSGIVRPTAYYRHYTSISLSNCYVYSNPSSDSDLITKDRTFNPMHPGSHSVPRIYADGWKSSEGQSSRYFTVWFGSKKLMLRNARRNKSKLHSVSVSDQESDSGSDSNDDSSDGDDDDDDDDDEKSRSGDNERHQSRGEFVKVASRLGVRGRSMIFLTRSRIERDLWVTKLLNEIERFSSADDDEVNFV